MARSDDENQIVFSRNRLVEHSGRTVCPLVCNWIPRRDASATFWSRAQRGLTLRTVPGLRDGIPFGFRSSSLQRGLFLRMLLMWGCPQHEHCQAKGPEPPQPAYIVTQQLRPSESFGW